MPGAVTLSQLAGKLDRVTVKCARCPGTGRMQVAALLTNTARISRCRTSLLIPADDRPRAKVTDPGGRCFVASVERAERDVAHE